MNEHEKILDILRSYNREWLNAYFNLVKDILETHKYTNSDNRISLALRGDKKIPLIIGRRWVVSALPEGKLELILGKDEQYVQYGAEHVADGDFNGKIECIWVRIPFKEQLPEPLYTAWMAAVNKEAKRNQRCNFSKIHSPELFTIITDKAARTQILDEAFAAPGNEEPKEI